MSKKKRKKKQGFAFPEVPAGIIMLCLLFMCREYFGPKYPLFVTACIAMIVLRPTFACIRAAIRKGQLLNASMDKIYYMDGVEFENCCIEHFRKLGYAAYPTVLSGDYGADILLKKNGATTVVQCKRYKGKVGVAAVQEVLGAKGYYNARHALVVTNSYFTPNAKKLAEANQVELWDHDNLVSRFHIQTGE